MPGIIVFNRRWSVGSDDLIVPAVILIILHTIWIIVLTVILNIVEFDSDDSCGVMLRKHILGFLVILCVSVVIEGLGAWMSLRGSILNTEPRSGMHYVLYVRLGVFIIEIVWQVVGVVWVVQHYATCTHLTPKYAILGIIICNWVVMLCIIISVWCTFDSAGHSWVKLKRYQESLKGREMHTHHKRCSGNSRRNWRHRKAMRKYEQSWDRRCRLLFCCIKEDRHRHSFAEVAKLFTEFFRDLDVVPSDIVAGLVLLRKHQQLHRRLIVSQDSNDVYEFLSGVAITPSTKFVDMQQEEIKAGYKKVVHYMRYALAAYGWPIYMMMNTGAGLCKIMPHLRCTCCCYLCCKPRKWQQKVVDDNCCRCNFAALSKLTGLNQLDLIYATYHVDIGETPFFIAVDHEEKTVVISIRGTLSLQDILTDLKADAEILPVEPVREDWLAHKGMVQAAAYIKKKIKDEMLLSNAFSRDLERGTQNYDLVVVGHSLGAGTAAILAIMMKQEYPSLQCYAYSPPGGLLSMTCVEETKYFITSVIVGKDFVPRIGLHQLEALRQDLINVIKKSTDPKWKIITSSMLCCCNERNKDLSATMTIEMSELMKQEKESRNFVHPADAQVALSTHTPLYLPGRLLHIVRNHNRPSGFWSCGHEESVYEAIWAENTDFDEVLISPVMANDHLPDKVLEALEKALTSPPMQHNVPCKSSDSRLEEREQDVINFYLGEEQPSSLFVISSTNQFLQREQSIEPKQVDCAALTVHDAKIPSVRPKFSLPMKSGKRKVSSMVMPHSRIGVPLASPEAFSDICSLSAIDFVGSTNGERNCEQDLQQTKKFRRSSSMPSTGDYGKLENSCLIDSTQLVPVRLPNVIEKLTYTEHTLNPMTLKTSVPSEDKLNSNDDADSSQPVASSESHSLLTRNGSSADIESVTYRQHSPDSDSPKNQFLYDHYVGHYSAAGRGYPHGFGCLNHMELHCALRIPQSCKESSAMKKTAEPVKALLYSQSLDDDNAYDNPQLNLNLS